MIRWALALGAVAVIWVLVREDGGVGFSRTYHELEAMWRLPPREPGDTVT